MECGLRSVECHHLRQPWHCDLQKTGNTTRLKCCACYAKWHERAPKCCACHEKCNASSENVATVLRVPHKTNLDTLWNTFTKCHASHAKRSYATLDTSKSDPFCRTYHRHGHTALTRTVANGCGRSRTVANGCGRSRTVANGCGRLRNVWRTQLKPSPTGTLATHSGINFADITMKWVGFKTSPNRSCGIGWVPNRSDSKWILRYPSGLSLFAAADHPERGPWVELEPPTVCPKNKTLWRSW